MNNFKIKIFLIPATLLGAYAGSANANNDRGDLDDIKLYDIVKVEQCLDAAFDDLFPHSLSMIRKLHP